MLLLLLLRWFIVAGGVGGVGVAGGVGDVGDPDDAVIEVDGAVTMTSSIEFMNN